jgi:hypothetical protein
MRSKSTPKLPFARIGALPYDGRIFDLLFLNSPPLDARLIPQIERAMAWQRTQN